MIYPKFLCDGDTIGVPAPSAGSSSKIDVNKFNKSKECFEELGYKLVLSDNLYSDIRERSADKKTRSKEINKMIKDDKIDFILSASGGEFLIECLPYIDFDLIKDNPKFFAGFSDPTGILFPLTTKYDIATIYGANFRTFGTSKLGKSHEDFLSLIKGEQFKFDSYSMYEGDRVEHKTGLEPYNLNKKVKWKTLDGKDTKFSGRIIGGCFDLINELIGTKFDGMKEFNERYKKDGIVWFFDNCELSCEETIRVLWKMDQFGYFKYCKGVIFGRFGNDSSYVGYDVQGCLKDSVLSELNIPVIYDADISHKPQSMPILIGSIATVACKDNKGSITFELE